MPPPADTRGELPLIPESQSPHGVTRSYRNKRRPQASSGALIDSAGPEPETPLSEVWLTTGVIAGAHGINGEMKVRLSTDDVEHFQSLRYVQLSDEETSRRVISCRLHQGMALLRLQGITTPEEITGLRGQALRVSGKSVRPLEPGEFYLYQLIGLRAETESGEALGTVSDLIETGAADVFVIRPETGQDLLLPDRPDVILGIYPETRRMVVRLLEYAE